MTAYLIANYDIVDRDTYKKYQRQSAPIMEGGGELVVFDRDTSKKEGEAGHQTVLISYPSKEAALAAYESDGYQAIIGIRLGAIKNGRAMIVSGVDEPRE